MRFRLSFAIILPIALLLLALRLLMWDVQPVQAEGTVSVCSEAALDAAVSAGGLINFIFPGSCVIHLTSTIFINTPTFIDGAGQDITISGDNTVGVFSIIFGGGLTLRNLNIINGKTVTSLGGGAILNNGGTVTIIESIFSGNQSSSYGGAIVNRVNGVLTILNSQFINNSAISSNAVGGAIEIENGTVTIINSAFNGNKADGAAFGGYGTGGVLNLDAGALTIVDSQFTNNQADAGPIATANGGAIAISGGVGNIEIIGSSFTNNKAVLNSGEGSDEARGGAVFSIHTGPIVSNSIFSGNQAIGVLGGDSGKGGAWYNYGGNSIFTNTTFVDNEAHGTGIHGNGLGGAFYLGSGSLTINNSTIADNQAAGDGQGIGGGFYSEGGGNVVTLNNDIFSNNSATNSNAHCRQPTTLTGGGNLAFPDLGGCPAAIFPTIGDPLLATLTDNGGPTLTLALGLGSPAINGDSTNCPATDQRFYTRPDNQALCDIGAYQRTNSVAPQPATITMNIVPKISDGNSLLTITISNPPSGQNLSHIYFSDMFPLGVVAGDVPGEVPGNTCGGQSAALGPTHSDAVTAYDISLTPNSSCAISLPIIAYVPGSFTNHIDTIFAAETGVTAVNASADLLAAPGISGDVPQLNFFTIASPTLTWSRVTNAAGYEIEIDDASDFKTPLYTDDQLSATTLTYTTPALTVGRYFWHVRAKLSNGDKGNWSAIQGFTVVPAN